VWATTVNGRVLHFHLAGINNQNFIMRDEETGSWWQQVTGEAIQGPLTGEHLRAVDYDELTFGLWKRESPQGRVLKPDEAIERAGEYAPADWDQRMSKVPVTTSAPLDKTLAARALVVGVTANGVSRAYPFDALVKQSPIVDELGRVPIILVMADDHKSVRGFARTIDGRQLEFFVKPDVSPLRLVDAQTASEWDFSGKAVSGPSTGKQLTRLAVLNEYWFDWKTYNPGTTLYQLGDR
jgi:hypothetical protein